MLPISRPIQFAMSVAKGQGLSINDGLPLGTSPRTLGEAVKMLAVEAGNEGALQWSGQEVKDYLFHCLTNERVVGTKMLATNDMQTLLSTTVHILMTAGWNRAAELTSYQWLSQSVKVDHLHNCTITRISDAPDVLLIPEGQGPQLAVVADEGQVATLTKWGRAILLTETAIQNDKIDILSLLPELLGAALRRKANDLYHRAIFTGNGQVMPDGLPLFSAAHGNIAPAAALSSASLNAAIAQMFALAKMSPDGGRTTITGIMPRYLVVSPADALTARQLTGSGIIGGTEIQGWHLDVLVEPSLPLLSGGTPWLLAADPLSLDYACVVTLVGNELPTVSIRVGRVGEAKGVFVDIGQYLAVYIVDHRGLVLNRGA